MRADRVAAVRNAVLESYPTAPAISVESPAAGAGVIAR